MPAPAHVTYHQALHAFIPAFVSDRVPPVVPSSPGREAGGEVVLSAVDLKSPAEDLQGLAARCPGEGR